MKRPIIAITMGDPAGIGPEIIIKALNNNSVLEACQPLIIGDRQIMEAAARRTGRGFSVKSLSQIQRSMPEEPAYLYESSHLPVNLVRSGIPDPEWGKPVLGYIRQAAQWALKGQINAIVTGPISKEVIQNSRSSFTGHTEYLADLARTKRFGMMLAGERLRVSLATIHLPLKKALKVLSTEKISQAIELTHEILTNHFGLQEPHIAVAGLNPHAGEKGAFGREEETLILPAVQSAQESGIRVTGPYPPDTLFYWAAQGRYDAVVALYHDQGLIPLKLLHFENAVNITMGLPFIRTSVDHGTAFDIAGRGLAKPDSLIAAILLAGQFCRNQKNHP
ncbi:MAG TPA: 4-hydroxythreonine-4-phosphate dehydrogenase PdxA [Thermodesulfobacteriota bacterium]|nr:4-hydroxythreonine-4-phosphate dehydrogenase PdxA [Thermodesulfobacteriota bacterium]